MRASHPLAVGWGSGAHKRRRASLAVAMDGPRCYGNAGEWRSAAYR